MTISPDLLRLKLAESLTAEPPVLTRRDVQRLVLSWPEIARLAREEGKPEVEPSE